MTSSPFRRITVELWAGTGLTQASRDIAELAKSTGVEVEGKFNDQMIRAWPNGEVGFVDA